MWSTRTKNRSSLSHVPSLPAIDVGYHRNGPTSPTSHRGSSSLEKRVASLEISNKALLEEMMHVHAAVRREKELASKSHSDTWLETQQRLSHTQALWEASSEELVSQNRRMADRLARLEAAMSGMGGVVTRVTAEKEKQGNMLKENFSSVHEHVSWLAKKMEGSVAELSNAIKNLDDSTTSKHSQLVTMVTKTIQTPLEERMYQLEQMFLEDQKSLSGFVGQMRDDLSGSIRQIKEKLNNLTESLSVESGKHKAQCGSLKESLSRVAKETKTNHQELSTVLKAEIKTRVKVLDAVRGQCVQVQGLCRGSVQALREGLLSLEERLASLRKEVHTGHEQQMIYCQEIGKRLHTDLDVHLSSLHHPIAKGSPHISSSGTFLTTIDEDPVDNSHKEDFPVISTNQNITSELLTIEQSKQLLEESRALLNESKELRSRGEQGEIVLEQLQSNLSQSEHLLETSRAVQANLTQAQQLLLQVHNQSHLNQNKLVLSEMETRLDRSKEALEHVQTTLHQSEEALHQLRIRLDQTGAAPYQMQPNLNHNKEVLDQLQLSLAQGREVLDETTSNISGNEQAHSYKEEGPPLSETTQNTMSEENGLASLNNHPHHTHTPGNHRLSVGSQASAESDSTVYSNAKSEREGIERQADPELDPDQLLNGHSHSEDTETEPTRSVSESEPKISSNEPGYLNLDSTTVPEESSVQNSSMADSIPATSQSNGRELGRDSVEGGTLEDSEQVESAESNSEGQGNNLTIISQNQ